MKTEDIKVPGTHGLGQKSNPGLTLLYSKKKPGASDAGQFENLANPITGFSMEEAMEDSPVSVSRPVLG